MNLLSVGNLRLFVFWGFRRPLTKTTALVLLFTERHTFKTTMAHGRPAFFRITLGDNVKFQDSINSQFETMAGSDLNQPALGSKRVD